MTTETIIPIIRKSGINKLLLIRWLKQRCSYSEDVFKDPGYSDYYKSAFNIVDDNIKNPFYIKGDIDHQLNIGYIFNSDTDDIQLEDFIDYIPRNTSLEEDVYDNIVILPGSNHSNANYLYKMICKYIDNSEDMNYNIPIVSADPSIPYSGLIKNAVIELNKENFYNFLRSYSKKTDCIYMSSKNINKHYIEDTEINTDSAPNTNKSLNLEINCINGILENLIFTINKYICDSKNIWYDVIVPFLESYDCLILHNIGYYDTETFINFMIDQKYYRLMITAQNRLKNRLRYLFNN